MCDDGAVWKNRTMVTGLRRLGLGASLGATLSVAFGTSRLFGTQRSAARAVEADRNGDVSLGELEGGRDAPPVLPEPLPLHVPDFDPWSREPEPPSEPPDVPWDPAAGDRRSGVERRVGGRDDLVARVMQAKNRRGGGDRRGGGAAGDPGAAGESGATGGPPG